MSYLPFAILAYLLNSLAVTIDKILLVRSIPNPLTYIFYISAFSLLILLALPFTYQPSVFSENWSVLLIFSKVMGISLIAVGLYLLTIGSSFISFSDLVTLTLIAFT